MTTFNPDIVNIFIEASSKLNLVKLQVLTNRLNNKAYNYQTPMQEGDNYIVWFFADWQNHLYVEEKDLETMFPESEIVEDITRELNNG